jgi:hypothetical protein
MTPHPAAHAADSRLSRGQWWLSGVAAVLMLGLAALAFRGMFTAVRVEMIPFFASLAWIVPVGVDLGIVILILLGILLEWLRMPMPSLRLVAGLLMAATMWLNIAAAHGSPVGIVGHLALPVLFIASVEAVRHAVRRRSGLAAGTVREGVPLARWLLALPSTFMLWRRMVLWQTTSYAVALDRERLRRAAIARLRAVHGARWKSLADAAVVWQLVHGIDVEHASEAVAALAPVTPAITPETLPESRPGTSPAARPGARPEAAPERVTAPALKLTAAKSRSMTPADLEPHVSAMLDAYGAVSQARIKRDLHVSTEKAAEALRRAKNARVVVPLGARHGSK